MLKRRYLFSILWVIAELRNVSAIYEGMIVPEGKYTFMVQILRGEHILCGGAIVDSTHVMTSAQCVNQNELHHYKIVSNTVSIGISRHRVVHSLKYVYIPKGHRKIGSLTYKDVAIFTVAEPFNSRLTPLKLPPLRKLPKPGVMLTLIGWGASAKTEHFSQQLKSLSIAMTDQERCLNRVKKWWNLSEEHMCVEHTTRFTRLGGAASGDIGSILTYEGFLVGIVTLATVDVHPLKPDIYTKVGYYNEYFNDILHHEKEFERKLQTERPVCPSPQLSPSDQVQNSKSCSDPSHSVVCASVYDHMARQQQVELAPSEAFISSEAFEEPINLVTQSPDDLNAGSADVEKHIPIHDVSQKRICVSLEDVQPDVEQYYRINPQSQDSVAQQNNLQLGDVDDLRCRVSSDDDDTFIKYLLFGPRTPATQVQEQPSTEQCSPTHSFVCALSRLSTQSQDHQVDQQRHHETADSSQGANNQETGMRMQSRSSIHDVGSQRFCVTPENVQPDPERYFRINTRSHAVVAQENNIPLSDVEDLRCRRNTDNEEAFINYLQHGIPTVPPQQCTYAHHEYVCALVRSHALGDQGTHQEHFQNVVTHQDTSNQGTGAGVQIGSQIHDVGSQRFCVAPENIQSDPERYYRVSPQSYAAVAQQSNIPLNDVDDLRCRKNTDDEDTFIKYLLYGIPTVPPQQCIYPHHDYVCALLRSHVSRHVYNEQQRENENVAGTLQDTSNAETGSKRPSTSSIPDVLDAKRFCVPSEHVQSDTERYYRISPQSFNSVAQQYNLRLVDVDNMRCHSTADSDDVFSNYFNTEYASQHFGSQLPETQQQFGAETPSQGSIIPGFTGTYENPQAGSSEVHQYPPPDATRVLPESGLDPMNFHPQPLPIEPEFTPPNTP